MIEQDEEGLSVADRTALVQRAERLRAAPMAAEEEELVWVAAFPVGSERYALPLEQVLLALPLRLVTPVPLAPPYVVGVLRHQGRVISVLSLSALVGSQHGWAEDPAMLVVVDAGAGRIVALDCEQVPKPTAMRARDLAAARARGGHIHEVVGPDLVRVNVLDVAALLRRARGA